MDLHHTYSNSPHNLTELDIDSDLIRKALRAAHNGVMITDLNGKILWVNDHVCELTGYSREELLGQNPRILKSDRGNKSTYVEMWNIISNGDVWNGKLTNRKKDGSLYIERLTITPIFNSEVVPQLVGYMGIQQEVIKEERVRAEVIKIIDSLSEMRERQSQRL